MLNKTLRVLLATLALATALTSPLAVSAAYAECNTAGSGDVCPR